MAHNGLLKTLEGWTELRCRYCNRIVASVDARQLTLGSSFKIIIRCKDNKCKTTNNFCFSNDKIAPGSIPPAIVSGAK